MIYTIATGIGKRLRRHIPPLYTCIVPGLRQGYGYTSATGAEVGHSATHVALHSDYTLYNLGCFGTRYQHALTHLHAHITKVGTTQDVLYRLVSEQSLDNILDTGNLIDREQGIAIEQQLRRVISAQLLEDKANKSFHLTGRIGIDQRSAYHSYCLLYIFYGHYDYNSLSTAIMNG
jgi:hypothetical protein